MHLSKASRLENGSHLILVVTSNAENIPSAQTHSHIHSKGLAIYSAACVCVCLFANGAHTLFDAFASSASMKKPNKQISNSFSNNL